jgi:hypothetical protein
MNVGINLDFRYLLKIEIYFFIFFKKQKFFFKKKKKKKKKKKNKQLHTDFLIL